MIQTMARVLTRTLLALLCMAASHCVGAAAPGTLVFDALDNERGLAQNTVSAIAQDSRGFLWFATQGGLQRYDGMQLVTVRTTPLISTGAGLRPDAVINAIVEDARQQLWMTSENAGIAVFDLGTGQFVELAPALKAWNALNRPVTALLHDGRQVWMASEGTLQVFDLERGEMRGIATGDVGRIHSMQLHPLGGVVLATERAGGLRVAADGELQTLLGNQPGALRAVVPDGEGGWWFGGTTGLWRVPASGAAVAEPLLSDAVVDVRSLIRDRRGDLWIGTRDRGVFQRRAQTGRLLQHSSQVRERYSLPENFITHLYIDRDEVLWLGTQRAGIARVNLQSQRFALFRDPSGNEAQNLRNNIRGILDEPSGRLWLGSDGAGLRSREADESWRDWTPVLEAALPPRHPGRANLRVLAVRRGEADSLWLGTSAGLMSLQIGTGRAERVFPTDPADPGGVVWAVQPAADGSVWFGLTGQGLLQWQRGRVLRSFRDSDAVPTRRLLSNRVLALHQDRFGGLWIGSDAGLQRLRANGELQTFQHRVGEDNSIASDRIRTFVEARDGRLWIGHHAGLTVLDHIDRDVPTLRNIGRAQGMVDDTVYGVLEDESGWLWMSSNRGISRYSPEDGRFIHYGLRDGLQGTEFNGGAVLRGLDGRMYFGGTNGTNAFLPAAVTLDPAPPVVHLTGYQIGRQAQTQTLGSALATLNIPYEERVLAFQFVGIDTEAASAVRYRYRLNGFDQDWSAPAPRGEARYTNLDARSYRLEIQAANRDGRWSDSLEVPLVISPPRWWSLEAKVGYASFVLVVVGWFWWAAWQRRREREAANALVHQSEERLKWAIWASGDSLWDWDVRADQIYREGVDRLLGYPAEMIEANSHWRERLIHPDDAALVPAAMQKHLAGEAAFFEAEYRMRAYDGRWVWVLDRGKVVERDSAGKPTRVAGTMKNVTERRHYEDELRHLANYDTLTSLPNRTLFMERLRHALAHARRTQQRVAVLFFDLDRFKQINDSLGHAAGDHLLKQVARRIHEQVREDDTVARLGGDEFTVILENLPAAQATAVVADKVLVAFQEPFDLDGHEVVISPSIGISLFPDDGDDVATLVKNADLAMYHAKEQGRNNYQYYVSAMNDVIRRRLALETALRKAIEHDEFTLYYQPKMDIATGAITGMEALLRWDSADLGRVPPDEFIPLAEENGLIVPIGEWVLKAACAQIGAWLKAGLPTVPVAVNLSIRQLMAGELSETVGVILRENALDPRWLQLEITESLVMANAAQAVGRLNALRDLGIRLSVDDFGTGYSSLSYLKRLPIDTIKIDKAFIRDITIDPDDATITKTIIAMAHSLKLTVVAEGVETVEQLQFLRDNRCEEMQGYWLSKPLPAEEMEKILRRHW